MNDQREYVYETVIYPPRGTPKMQPGFASVKPRPRADRLLSCVCFAAFVALLLWCLQRLGWFHLSDPAFALWYGAVGTHVLMHLAGESRDREGQR